MVQHIREGVELRFVSRSRDVHAVATRELLPWHNKVQFDAIQMGVRHPQAVKLVVLQPSESQLFKELHYSRHIWNIGQAIFVKHELGAMGIKIRGKLIQISQFQNPGLLFYHVLHPIYFYDMIIGSGGK